jgi:adenine-specific DNA-methyltransferase
MAREKKPFSTPLQALNKAYRKQKVYRGDIDKFRSNLGTLLKELDEKESEEHLKNDVIQFLNDTWYKGQYAINTKGRTDLVIHNDKTAKSTAGVLLEVKKPSNKSEMVNQKKLNAKALQELVLYYLRERIENENTDIKHLVITNVYEWFVFDSSVFYDAFYKNPQLVKAFKEWNTGQKDSSKTELFYKDIAALAIDEKLTELTYTWFDFREFEKDLAKDGDSKKLLSLYKLLSPVHLLKQPFANDSNSLNKQFYNELLHIIGLEEVKDGGKKVIKRKDKGRRDAGSLLENAAMILDERDRMRMLERPSYFGKDVDEQAYNVSLELCITWVNRVLFLKLLESQLVGYHKGDANYRFLNSKTIPDYDVLDRLFFGVLARKQGDRHEGYKEAFAHIPYLNSSLFEPTGLEEVLSIAMLSHDTPIDVYTQTVLKDGKGKRISGKKDPLTYLFEFLDAYDFSSEGKEEIQEDSKSLINASVLGLIFEKINGYKDGSFYTPGFITMYMCRETIRRAIVQKFNEEKGWRLEKFEQLYDKVGDNKKEANDIINSLKICDPAVGSGHFLVSALNEIISIKSELRILIDKDGKTLRDYDITIENDELIITDDNGAFFEYTLGSNEKQRVQETLFHEKQIIIENCLFGVDINPNSVKICRLRLWIELLKNAYYLNQGDKNELQTLPNIDINIKTGNSLISRFDLDTDISQALKKSKWDITTYRNAVDSYKNATSKEDKREFERLISSIKGDFETEIGKRDKRLVRVNKLKGDLMKLTQQTDLFGLTGVKKKAWQKEVDTKTKALQKVEQELEEVRNNKIFEDAFEWRFEFPEVLDNEGNFRGFDVVIGNPPYIRQEELKEFKEQFKSTFSTYSGTADIYVFFIERGFSIMRDQGHFIYIMPNKFMQAGYGKSARHFLLKNDLVEIVDFGDLQVFDGATTYPCIVTAKKSQPSSDLFTLPVTTLEYPLGFLKYVYSHRNDIQQKSLSDETWVISNVEDQNLLDKIKNAGKPLTEFVRGGAKRGVVTGLTEAFVINESKKDELIHGNEKNRQIIKPLILGRDLKPYNYVIPNKNLLFIPWHFPLHEDLSIKGASERAASVFEKEYPDIFDHLSKYKEGLNSRNKVETGIRYEWYAMQRYASDYYSDFEKPKIMYQAFQVKPCFIFDDQGLFCNNSIWFISSDDKVLLGILNSKIGWWLISKYCTQIQNGYQLIWKYFSQIPIVKGDSKQRKLIEGKVNQILDLKKANPDEDTLALENEIDQLVYEVYGLTEEEIKLVEDQK